MGGTVYKSPQKDMGYDISDYRDVDPRYGTLADLEELEKGLHERGMKLVMDLVVNHTSNEVCFISFPIFRGGFQSGGDMAMDIKSVNSMPGLRNLGPRRIIRRRIGTFGRIREPTVMAKDNPRIIGRPFSEVNRRISRPLATDP